MKDSIYHSKDLISVDHELCCQKKCANCFELGGCIYEQFPVVKIDQVTESKADSQLKDFAPIPQRA